MKFMLITTLFVSTVVFAGENKKPDAQAIDAACTQEAATAGCGDKKVGTGLLKCIHAYRKEHKDFKPAEACKSAIQKNRTDRKAAR